MHILTPVLALLVGLLFGIAGVLLLILPPRVILKWDRRTGYWLATHIAPPERGALIAGVFYKIFGAALLAVVVLGIVPAIFR